MSQAKAGLVQDHTGHAPSRRDALVALCADYSDLEPDSGPFQAVSGNGTAVVGEDNGNAGPARLEQSGLGKTIPDPVKCKFHGVGCLGVLHQAGVSYQSW